MARGKVAAKVGRAACPHAAEDGVLATKNIETTKAMKPSGVAWLGDIPEGWEIGRVKNSFYHTKEVVKERAAEFDRLALTLQGVIKRPKEDTNGLQPKEFEGYQVLRKNELVFKLIDLQNISTSRVGRSSYDGIVSPAYIILHPRDNSSTAFACYYFLSMWMHNIFQTLGGDAVRSCLNASDLLNVPLPLPPLPEQRAIADYLDEKCGAIDAAIAEAKKGIEEYKAWKKSIIFEAVTGKRRVGAFNAKTQCRREAEKMKPSGIPWIGAIPEGWRVMRLKHLIGILPGYAFKSEDFNFSNGIRLLRGINVGVDSLRWDECVYWDRVISEDLDRYQIQAGDLIVGLDRPWIEEGTRVCFAKKEDLPCLLVQRVCRIRTLGEMDLRIINYWLSSEAFERALACDTTGVSVPHISPYQIMEFRITLPSLPEQRAIADYLDEKCAAIDAMVVEKEALIADLEAYKKSLIYETVTGKREVA